MIALEGKKVVVIGMGRSGVAAARFCVAHGARVQCCDEKGEAELAQVREKLTGLPVTWSLGQRDPVISDEAACLIVSPGVPLDLPSIQAARARGLAVVGEMELAVQRIVRPIVAVTGTNGKTTTTALIGHLLERAGLAPLVAGNIGTPILEDLEAANRAEVVVLEVSSFQIETTPSLAPQVAIWLNATPDHLDRHGSFAAYVAAKAQLIHQVPRQGWAVVNAADPVVCDAVRTATCRMMPFDAAAALDGDALVVQLPGGEPERYDISTAQLLGRHNQENMLAALIATRLLGAEPEALRAGLSSFAGLAHRLTFIDEIEGVRFIDDSKGTNVGATIQAIRAFSRPIVLIAGGVAKGANFSELSDAMRGRVRQAILIGEAADEMEEALRDVAPIARAQTMEEAVRWAADEAQSGDVVLLSPACASFDMFENYARRGEAFQAAVKGLHA